jgi:hypothetical protein
MNTAPPTNEELLDTARHADDGALSVQEAYLALPGKFPECRARPVRPSSWGSGWNSASSGGIEGIWG